MARLPILATVEQTYRFVFANLAALGTLSRVWAIAALAAFAASWFLMQLALQGQPDQEYGAGPLSAGEQIAAVTSLSVLIAAVAAYVIVVRWHRMIIRGTGPAETRPRALSAGFLYLARTSLLGGLTVAIAMAGGLLPSTLTRGLALPGDIKAMLPAVFIVGAVVGAVLIAGRLSLILPGGAIGDFTMTLRRSWGLTRGNSWRILLGSILASGPAVLANLAFNGFIESLPGRGGDTTVLTVSLALSLVLVVLAAVVQATFLSYAYLQFVPDPATK